MPTKDTRALALQNGKMSFVIVGWNETFLSFFLNRACGIFLSMSKTHLISD